MLFILLFLVICTLLVNVYRNEINFDVAMLSLTFTASLIVNFCICMFVADVFKLYKFEEPVTTYEDIYSLERKSEIFSVGRGLVNEKQKYFVFQSYGDKGYMLGNVDSDICPIYEVDEKPRIEEVTNEYTVSKYILPFAFPRQTHSYSLYVPKHTIVKEFKG